MSWKNYLQQNNVYESEGQRVARGTVGAEHCSAPTRSTGCLSPLRLCHEPSVGDTIVGDVFAHLLDQFAIGNGLRSDPRLFLYQTAYRSIVQYLRDGQHDLSVGPVISTFEKSEITASQLKGEARTPEEALFSALHNELTEDQRHVMSLYFLDDFSIKETAQIIGKKVNEIKVSIEGIQKVMDNHSELSTGSLGKKMKKR